MRIEIVPVARESTDGLVSAGQLIVTAGGVAVAEDTAGLMTFGVNTFPMYEYVVLPMGTPEEPEPPGEVLLKSYARRFEQAFRPYGGPDERPTFEPEDLPSG